MIREILIKTFHFIKCLKREKKMPNNFESPSSLFVVLHLKKYINNEIRKVKRPS